MDSDYVCEKCSGSLYDTTFKKCDFCLDYYCKKCDPHFENVITFKDEGYVLHFCKVFCIEEYIHMIIMSQ